VKRSCEPGEGVGEANDRPLIIDHRRSIPGIASDISKVNRNTVLPEHGMSSAAISNRNKTISGDADHLSEIIDRHGAPKHEEVSLEHAK